MIPWPKENGQEDKQTMMIDPPITTHKTKDSTTITPQHGDMIKILLLRGCPPKTWV